MTLKHQDYYGETLWPIPKAGCSKKLLGEIVFREGEFGNKIYVVKQGAIRIVSQREYKTVTLGVLKNGACFGEMAVISSAPRVASAIADSPTELYEIDKSEIDKMIAELPPLFRAIVFSLIKRVSTLNNFATEHASVVKPMVSMSNLIYLLYQGHDSEKAVNNYLVEMDNLIDEDEEAFSIPV